MASLVKNVDQILGCVPVTHSHDHQDDEGDGTGRTSKHSHSPRNKAPMDQTPFELLHSLPSSHFPSISDVQEKYVDFAQQHKEHEKKQWEKEGEAFLEEASAAEKQRAIEREKKAMKSAISNGKQEG